MGKDFLSKIGILVISFSMSASASPVVKELPIDVFIVSGARFSEAEARRMIDRTDRKLQRAGIAIKINSLQRIRNKKLAFVNDDNVEILLKNFGSEDRPRLFFIREYVDPTHDAWTYDPVIGGNTAQDRHWKGAIFIGDAWAGFDEDMYRFRGFLAKSDVLLHELGHILLQQADHIHNSTVLNFFNHNPQYCDDSISTEQALKMQKSHYLRSWSSPLRSLSSKTPLSD